MLILRDVLGFSAREVAETLDTTVASVTAHCSAHARRSTSGSPSAASRPRCARSGDARVRELVERFIDAFERGDVDAILSMLAEDATFAMPPYADWCRGRDAIAASWLMPSLPAADLRYIHDARQRPTRAGHLPLEPDVRRYVPIALDVLTFGRRGDRRRGRVSGRRTLFERFGLPGTLSS